MESVGATAETRRCAVHDFAGTQHGRPMTLDHMSVVRRAADECILLFAGILMRGALAGMPPRSLCSSYRVDPALTP